MHRTERILIVGGGGREHALAWRLSRDPEVEHVRVAPGNDGIRDPLRRHPVAASDAESIARLARAEGVTLAVIGPEAPLAAGLADHLRAAGIATFGPGREGARLEASKWTAKQLMQEAGIPTARAIVFDSLAAARAGLDGFAPPWVIKADGLASGKGVRVTPERGEAECFLHECFEQDRFGEAGRRVVLEEYLAGEEASLMAVCDGERFVMLPTARDYKRAFDGNRGPNTGGMGACAPAENVDEAVERAVGERIVSPVLAAMARRGTPYRGLLYVGLMRTPSGPKVVEFNCRFGDPETQAVLPLVEGSLARLLAGAAAGRIEDGIGRADAASVSVAIVEDGYPDASAGGGVLDGLEAIAGHDDVWVFHAGLERSGAGWRLTGGRAAHVVARASSRTAARERAYRAIGSLGGHGWRCRADIGADCGAPGLAAGAYEGATGGTRT